MRQYIQYSVEATFTAVNEPQVKQILFNNEFDFVCQEMKAYSSNGDYSVQMLQGNQLYQNAYVNAVNVFGTVQYPAVMLTPMIIKRGTNFQLNIKNGVGLAGNKVQLVLVGYHTDEILPNDKQWFQYPLETVVFAGASANEWRTITNNNGYDFVIEKFIGNATADDYYVRMTDANIQWTLNLDHSQTTIGTAQRPHILKQKITMPAGATLQVQILNGATAVNSIQIVYEGYLVKPISG